MAQFADDVTMQRAEHFAAAALPRLGPLRDQMRLTVGETQVGYTLLLAEVLSRFSPADRKVIAEQLPASCSTWRRNLTAGVFEEQGAEPPSSSHLRV